MEGGDAAIQKLELISTTGFNGKVLGALKFHPDRDHFIYPLGNTVIVENISKNTQESLMGHTNIVSCIAVSKDGKFIASGQITYMGFKADIIIWDFKSRSLYCRLNLHKVKVQALAFSPSARYLVSLGGQDDGSVVVWDVAEKKSVCGAPAAIKSAGITSCIAYCHTDEHQFVTAGDLSMRVWKLDVANRKIRPEECRVGQLKRYVKCLEISLDDKHFYCGTTSGDVLQFNMDNMLMQLKGPEKDTFCKGIMSMALLWTGEVLVGAGDGTVAVIKGKQFKRIKSKKLPDDCAITSIALRGEGHQFLIGTDRSQIHRFQLAEFTMDTVRSCHFASVKDIVFPHGYSDVYGTCSRDDIRVWNAKTRKELVCIRVHNMTCNAIDFLRDGKAIVSAWNDNKIRVFAPQSGKLIFLIEDAHQKGVTAITTTSDCKNIISGGGEGQVRMWDIANGPGKLLAVMKEHKGEVTCIVVRSDDTECISASCDGSCIIWNIKRYTRNLVIFGNTLFKCVTYSAEETQCITSGTDRKIGYWEMFDASQIREIDGSKSGAINGMVMAPDGKHFVTGGDDKLVKVWEYNEGPVTHAGVGHSGQINRVRICPNQQTIVSVSDDGAILCWKYPYPAVA